MYQFEDNNVGDEQYLGLNSLFFLYRFPSLAFQESHDVCHEDGDDDDDDDDDVDSDSLCEDSCHFVERN